MPTPSPDFELATEFVYCEGILNHRSDIKTIRYGIDPNVDSKQRQTVVRVE